MDWAPDCVLLDLMLPDDNGYRVCETLRQRDETVPIIILGQGGDAGDHVGLPADHVLREEAGGPGPCRRRARPGTSSCVTTANTPGSARARDTSMLTMRA